MGILDVMRHGHAEPIADQHYKEAVTEMEGLRKLLQRCRARIKAQTEVGLLSADPENEDPQHSFMEFLADLDRVLGEDTPRPCGECHLKPGEVCDICGRSLKIERPKGSNADEWHLFVREHRNTPEFLAVQIAEAIDDSRGRDDARDRLMLSMSDALTRLLRDLPGQEQKQIRHNLAGCCGDLLAASGLEHGRPSGWRDQINKSS